MISNFLGPFLTYLPTRHTDRSGLQLSRVLTKYYPTTPGYPWVSGGWYVTLEPIFTGLELDHHGLEELELKKHPKTTVFDQIRLFLSSFLVLVLFKVNGRAPNLQIWVLGCHTDPQIPMGTLGAVE